MCFYVFRFTFYVLRFTFYVLRFVISLILFNSRRNPFGLLVSLNSSGGATGNLFWDDGESTGTDIKNSDDKTEFADLLNTFPAASADCSMSDAKV